MGIAMVVEVLNEAQIKKVLAIKKAELEAVTKAVQTKIDQLALLGTVDPDSLQKLRIESFIDWMMNDDEIKRTEWEIHWAKYLESKLEEAFMKAQDQIKRNEKKLIVADRVAHKSKG